MQKTLTWDEKEKYRAKLRPAVNFDDYVDISRNLQEARIRSGLTQDDVADILHVATRTITRIETADYSRLPIELILQCCDLYDCSLSDIFPDRYTPIINEQNSLFSMVGPEVLIAMSRAAEKELSRRTIM